jgi:hypothetical protein
VSKDRESKAASVPTFELFVQLVKRHRLTFVPSVQKKAKKSLLEGGVCAIYEKCNGLKGACPASFWVSPAWLPSLTLKLNMESQLERRRRLISLEVARNGGFIRETHCRSSQGRGASYEGKEDRNRPTFTFRESMMGKTTANSEKDENGRAAFSQKNKKDEWMELFLPLPFPFPSLPPPSLPLPSLR